MSFTTRNINFGKKIQNEFTIISNLLNDIQKSEKIRMKIFCFNDIFSEEFFNILFKIISFYFHLSKTLKNLQNYDNLLKHYKNEISNEIKKFFDKILIFRKSKDYYLNYYIEKQINFFLFSHKKKENKKKSQTKKKKIEIITNSNLNLEKNLVFSLENQKKVKGIKYKSLSQTKLSNISNTDILKDKNKKSQKNTKKNLLKKESNISRNSLNKTLNNGENSTNKSSISYSNILIKNMGLNQSMKKKSNSKEKKSNEENKVNNNSKEVKYHYIQIPNLNYLSLIMKNKSERKMLLKSKSKSPNKFVPNIKLIDTGPKPSIYTHYLLNKFKGFIDNYNVEEQKNYSPCFNKYQSHSSCNIKRNISDSSQKSIYND